MDRSSLVFFIVVAASASLFYLSAKDAEDYNSECLETGKNLVLGLIHHEPLPVRVSKDDKDLIAKLTYYLPANDFEQSVIPLLHTKRYLGNFLKRCDSALKTVKQDCKFTTPIATVMWDYISKNGYTEQKPLPINDVESEEWMRTFKKYAKTCKDLAQNNAD